MHSKILMLATLAVSLAGCADWAGRQRDQDAKYVGAPLESLYPEYGVPVGRAPLQNGGQFLEFEYRRGGYLCTAKVATSARGTITSIKVGGQNGCVTPF